MGMAVDPPKRENTFEVEIVTTERCVVKARDVYELKQKIWDASNRTPTTTLTQLSRKQHYHIIKRN